MTTVNREYKNSLFTSYFSDKRRLIEAYNAIAGTDFPPTAEVEFKTLENVLFQSQINDLAFTIEGKFVVLIEHQSTVNENMPLRLLMYIAEVYKKIVPQRALYKKWAVPIPTPEFFVIYNGVDDYPEKTVLRLSDAYICPAIRPNLELIVPVYNIAKGNNAELLKQSKALSDYARFVSLVYDAAKNGDTLEAAIEKAILYCMENDIMTVYLEKDNGEVLQMLSMEWDDDVYREVIREEALEEGMEKGADRKNLENARKMKEYGDPVEKIAAITGLPEDEILKL